MDMECPTSNVLLKDPNGEDLGRLCQNIYETDNWPGDFLRTITIPIRKKNDATQCSEFRTVRLIFHALKTIPRIIIKNRLPRKQKPLAGND